MTEWYPAAQANQPNVVPTILQDPNVASELIWRDVRISRPFASVRALSRPVRTGRSAMRIPT